VAGEEIDLCNAVDHVDDETSHGSQTGDMLPSTMSDNQLDLLVPDLFDFHVNVTQGLGQFAPGSLNSHKA
jgi:hypothetical protein